MSETALATLYPSAIRPVPAPPPAAASPPLAPPPAPAAAAPTPPAQPDHPARLLYFDSRFNAETGDAARGMWLVGNCKNGMPLMRSVFMSLAILSGLVLANAARAAPPPPGVQVGGNAAQFQAGLTAYRERDYASALKDWRPLAEQGDAGAQYNLGMMYDLGQGVPRNYVEAVKWWRLAAAQGDGLAQNNLGALYGAGRGIPRNYVESYKWRSLALAQGFSQAGKALDALSTLMTPAQIAEAQRLAAAFRPQTTPAP